MARGLGRRAPCQSMGGRARVLGGIAFAPMAWSLARLLSQAGQRCVTRQPSEMHTADLLHGVLPGSCRTLKKQLGIPTV